MSDIQNRKNSHTRVSYERDPTYGERVSRSCGGIVFGWLLLVGAVLLLFWNEGRAVTQYNTIQEGISKVAPLGYMDDTAVPEDGALIHYSGKLYPEVLRDGEFGLQVSAITLERVVEMYQWHEKQERREYKENGGKRVETTYTYYPAWSANQIDHTRFDDPNGHENPTHTRFSGATYHSQHVKAGPYVLSSSLRSMVPGWTALSISKATLPSGLRQQSDFAVSGDLNNPQIGDVRVSFRYNGKKGTEVSIIGQARGGAVGPYRSKAGNNIELLSVGVVSAEDMFSSEETANFLMTWALRFVGWLLTVMALSMTNDILYTIADFIPIVRDIISASLTILNLTLGTTISMVVIAVGWIRYRPMLAVGLLAGALALTYFLITGARRRSQSKRKD